MSYSIDANVLLYAANSSCPEHAAARGFLERAASGSELLFLTWPTVMAFLRISTHPRIFPSPLSWKEARQRVDSLLALPQVRVIGELEGFWDAFESLVGGLSLRGNLVPDAHLASTLKQNGVTTLYTNDGDFRRFEFLSVRNPLKT